MKPQRPGDLLLFEDWFYLIVPNDGDYFPDATVEAHKEPGGPERCKSVRIEARPLRQVGDLGSFKLTLKHRAAVLVEQHAKHAHALWFPEWQRTLDRFTDDLLRQATAYRAAGKRIWYAPDRLFSNPNPDQMPLTPLFGERPVSLLVEGHP